MATRRKPAVDAKTEARQFTIRILALFIASGLAVVTTGVAIGVEVWKAILMGGAAGIAQFVEKLARSAVLDGDITKEDLDKVLDDLAD